MELPDGMMLPILVALVLALLLPLVFRTLSSTPSKRRAPTTLRPDAQARALALLICSGNRRRGRQPTNETGRACSTLTELPAPCRSS